MLLRINIPSMNRRTVGLWIELPFTQLLKLSRDGGAAQPLTEVCIVVHFTNNIGQA